MNRFALALALLAGPLAPLAPAQTALYVANSGDSTVKKIPPGGGSFTTYATGFNFPVGLAVANNGTMYVSDFNAGTILKVTNNGSTITTYATGFNSPTG